MGTVEPIRKLEDLRKVENILAKCKRDLLFFTIGTNCGLEISDILLLNIKGMRILQCIKKLNHSNSLVALRYIGIEQEEIERSYSTFIM